MLRCNCYTTDFGACRSDCQVFSLSIAPRRIGDTTAGLPDDNCTPPHVCQPVDGSGLGYILVTSCADGRTAPNYQVALYRSKPARPAVSIWVDHYDALSIVYFIATAALPATQVLTTVNTGLGLLILLDPVARFWISENLRRELLRIYTIADLLVLLSVLLAPLITGNFAFLRVLRGLRPIHAYHLLRDLRRESLFFRRHGDAILAAVNLFVFIL